MSQQRQGVPYIPLHDRPLPPRDPNMPPSPRYAPNSDDEAERDAEQQAEGSTSASRKRQRSEEDQSRSVRPTRAPEPVQSVLAPSIFGVAPRVEFTATVGKWLMDVCRGQENVEVSQTILACMLICARSKSSSVTYSGVDNPWLPLLGPKAVSLNVPFHYRTETCSRPS